MRTYRILYRRPGVGTPFQMNKLGRDSYVADGPSAALQQHLNGIGTVSQPYQFLVQDTQSWACWMFEIPAVVKFQAC